MRGESKGEGEEEEEEEEEAEGEGEGEGGKRMFVKKYIKFVKIHFNINKLNLLYFVSSIREKEKIYVSSLVDVWIT